MKMLVKFESDWADEFSVYAFKIFEPSEWRDSVRQFKNSEPGMRYWNFGSNEGFEIEDRDDWLSKYEAVPITDLEFDSYKQAFGVDWRHSVEFGNFPDLEEMNEGYDE